MPRPAARQLHAVKEGNPAHRPIREVPKLPPAMPPEPDWEAIFPAARAELVGLKGAERAKATRIARANAGAARRCRSVSRAAWRRWARVLHAQGLLAELDPEALADAAVCWAQLDMANRDIARRGIWVEGERGAVKNPSTTAAAQFRTAFKNYIAFLGLAPAARVGLVASWDPGGGGGEEDDPFD